MTPGKPSIDKTLPPPHFSNYDWLNGGHVFASASPFCCVMTVMIFSKTYLAACLLIVYVLNTGLESDCKVCAAQ